MSTAKQKMVKWPDLSEYGISFGVLDMPDGSSRLVMVDVEGGWSNLAQEMGFSQSRWVGLYVMLRTDADGRPSMTLKIPNFSSRFPAAKVVEMTTEELRESVRSKILERRNYRVSQVTANANRLSWRPDEVPATTISAAASEEDATATVGNALKQTIYIGLNSLGEEVFEAGDGQRFARAHDQSEVKEDQAQPARFIRAQSDLDLIDAATGMLLMVDRGQRLGSEDFIRYAEAIAGPTATEDRAFIGRFQLAIDAAMERAARTEEDDVAVFRKALRLHEGRPPFWRPEVTPSAPLPLSLALDFIAKQARAAQGAGAVELNSGRRPVGDLRVEFDAVHGADPSKVAHSILTTYQLLGAQTEGRDASWSADQVINSLANRSAEGCSVFWMAAKNPGRIEPEARRLIAKIGQQYNIDGILDLDASLIAPGSKQASRLVVVGSRRAADDATYAIPATAPRAYEYTDVWRFAETIGAKLQGRQVDSFEIDAEENRWQVPYIPTSRVSEPETMVPRNLLAPVKQALQALEDRHGMTVDEFVASKLKWTMSELGQRLTSEQIDSVALSIEALDTNSGFVTADGTGIGKGRQGAAVALYASRMGKPVIFLTGSAELFGTFYRDVLAIGAMDELGKPFVVNSDHVIRDEETGKEIARSIGREEHHRILSCGEFPLDRRIALATYSQFNRQYKRSNAAPATAIFRTIRELLTTSISEFEAIKKVAKALDLPDYPSLGIDTAEDAATYEQRIAENKRMAGQKDAASEHDANAKLLRMPRKELLENLSARVKVDSTTLKHQWLYSGALDGALVIADESHYAAGESSQTGVNLRYLVERSSAVMYSSATFAKDVANFGLYERLFPSTVRISTMTSTLKRGGEAMQEILSSMLAQDGKLIRREHDLSTLEAVLTVDQEHMARNREWASQFSFVLSAMSYLSGELSDMVMRRNEGYQQEHEKLYNAALAAKPGASKAAIPALGVHYTHFASKFYNLSRIFLMAMKADHVADQAIKYLREGKKPLIAVENTLDSALHELVNGVELDQESDAQDELSPASSPRAQGAQSGLALDGGQAITRNDGEYQLNRRVSFKDLVLAYLDGMFEARLRTKQNSRITASERISLLTPELAKARDEVRAMLERMPEVPLSPLDLVRDRIMAAGFSIGEISGRKWQLKTLANGNHAVVRYPPRNKQAQARAFNNAQMDALLASKSGFTCIVLHAC